MGEKHNNLPRSDLSVSGSRTWEQYRGCSYLDAPYSAVSLENPHFKFPCNQHISGKPVTTLSNKPPVRRIMVDLRPVLEQVMESGDEEEDSSDCGNKCIYHLRDESFQPQREENKFRVSVPLNKKKGIREVNVYLPPLPQSQAESRTELEEQRRVSLVAVRHDGALTCHFKPKPTYPLPDCFPRVILSQEPAQKTLEKERLFRNTEWLAVEKLQLPLSEFVKAVRERTDSGQHTLITRILCSIRETQEQIFSQNRGELGDYLSGEIPPSKRRYPCKQDNIKLTWVKRS